MADVDTAPASQHAAGNKKARTGQDTGQIMVSIVAGQGKAARLDHRIRVVHRVVGLMVFLAFTLVSASGLSGCAWLQAKERQIALRPSAGAPANADTALAWRPGDLRYTVPSASAPDQPLALWWLPQADPGAPTLLYLHGTLRTLYGNAPKIEALRQAGFAILAVDYRGWGDSAPIVPSEATIMADAWQAWADLQRRQPDPGRRVLFGHSMGSAVAVQLASQLRHGSDYGALALESAFTSLPDVAAEAGFWGRIGAAVTTLQFDSASRIAAVDAPIWMLHGDADKTVPVVLGRRLRDAARPGVHWIEVPGGSHSRLHQDAPGLYQQSFRDLQAALPTVSRSNPPTQERKPTP
jgi:hypothetical protein